MSGLCHGASTFSILRLILGIIFLQALAPVFGPPGFRFGTVTVLLGGLFWTSRAIVPHIFNHRSVAESPRKLFIYSLGLEGNCPSDIKNCLRFTQFSSHRNTLASESDNGNGKSVPVRDGPTL
ncbi:uncharacterized protein B0H64DRAFT_106491 [Chaetomium fimeti]|uniref:Uncharacterized protein n=1 Tax=Chaetomium fimeti TaxID=1854472 RepID=A0AAE0HJB4_9PEZI|nr:hypothetical protein B0H64DRAFT_106491 [Chaetomium fimeti]